MTEFFLNYHFNKFYKLSTCTKKYLQMHVLVLGEAPGLNSFLKINSHSTVHWVFFPLSFSFAYLNKQVDFMPVFISLSHLHAKLETINYGKAFLCPWLLFHFIITKACLGSRVTIGSYQTMGNRSNQNALKPTVEISKTNVSITDKCRRDIYHITSVVSTMFECCDFIRRRLLGIRHVNIAGVLRNVVIRFKCNIMLDKLAMWW